MPFAVGWEGMVGVQDENTAPSAAVQDAVRGNGALVAAEGTADAADGMVGVLLEGHTGAPHCLHSSGWGDVGTVGLEMRPRATEAESVREGRERCSDMARHCRLGEVAVAGAGLGAVVEAWDAAAVWKVCVERRWTGDSCAGTAKAACSGWALGKAR